jgi:S1-C subfamily serine protease
MRRRLWMVALTSLMLSSLACSYGLGLPQLSEGTSPTNPPAAEITVAPPATSLPPSQATRAPAPGSLSDLYQQVSDGVVSILIFPAGGASDSLPIAQGSGFVIDADGHIVTNQHVVAEGGDIEVDFPSGEKAYATLVGTDPDSDLAVLKVDVPAGTLKPLPLGDSDTVLVGDTVVAIGNPFGLSGTMTVGVVSAVGRTLESEHAAPGGTPFTAGDIIQTDAAINPGNSGGPLLDQSGQVIGVNRAIRTDSTNASGSPLNSGIGFAVPINIVRRVVPVLIETGHYDYPYVGIQSLDDQLWTLKTLDALNLPSDANGAYVTCVTPGGPADQAGVNGAGDCFQTGLNPGGDLITAIDGNPVRQFSDLLSYLINETSPGDQVTLTVLRNGQQMDITVTLQPRPN